MAETKTKVRPKPFLFPEFCKACGRCISACPKGCITMGTEINPATGFTPVVVNLEVCNGCGLCLTACPEPYGLTTVPAEELDFELLDPEMLFGEQPGFRSIMEEALAGVK